MRCPRDGVPLRRLVIPGASLHDCERCAGRAVSVALLKRMMPRARFRELWTIVRGGEPSDAACPSCGRAMHLVRPPGADPAGPVDGCVACQVLWFDSGELRAVAPAAFAPRPAIDAPVPADAGEQWVWNRFFRRLKEHRFGAWDVM